MNVQTQMSTSRARVYEQACYNDVKYGVVSRQVSLPAPRAVDGYPLAAIGSYLVIYLLASSRTGSGKTIRSSRSGTLSSKNDTEQRERTDGHGTYWSIKHAKWATLSTYLVTKPVKTSTEQTNGILRIAVTRQHFVNVNQIDSNDC